MENLHPVPETVPDEAAVFVEPLAAAVEILEQVHIQPDQHVLVIGAGRLGQLAAQVLALSGCELQVVARYPAQQRRLAKRGIPWIQAEQVGGRQADVVVEASGSPEGFALARHAVRPRGTIVLKSTYRGEMSLNISAIVVDEIRLVGSRCGPFHPALRHLEMGQVDPSLLIDDIFPLEKGLAAFESAVRPGASKIILKPA
jgi:threonine dehydrogenase-like Zn-dependent dehydrogenase